jgi:hypothetical protein
LKYIFCCLFALLLLGCSNGKQEQPSPAYTLSEEELSHLQSGDIIFRMGYGAMSLSIVSILNDSIKVSHCGIVVRGSAGLKIVHTISQSLSDADGMQECTVEEFIADSRENSIAAVRFKHADKQQIADKAIYYLDKKIPFDSYFDLIDSSAFFCSELPMRILKDEFNFDLLQGGESLMQNCKFSTFFDPQYFQVIINHHLRK